METEKTARKSLSEVNSSIDTTQGKGWRKLLAFLGPAYLVSVGYMDPGNWATDIAGGARFGYALIWVLLMSNIMALLLQSLSARLGIVRQLDLAQASRSTYSRGVNFALDPSSALPTSCTMNSGAATPMAPSCRPRPVRSRVTSPPSSRRPACPRRGCS